MDTFRLFPPQASEQALKVDHLFYFLCGVSAFFALLICALVVTFAVKYRRRHPDEIPPKAPTPMSLEIAWTGIPLLITVVMFVWGAEVFVSAQEPPADTMQIFVVGKRWMWQIQHPEGRKEINTLHVPVGRPVKLTLISQDVIHDFGLPAFRIKKDVLPGAYTTEWFTATKVGEYHLFCDQFCGAKHAEMVGTVVVCDPAQYASWLAGTESDTPPRVAGQKLFMQYGCVNCHGLYAPTLAGLYGRPVDVIDEQGKHRTVIADESYLRESILNPSAKLVAGFPNRMPSFRSSLSEEQLMQLLEYIKSLSGAADTGPYRGNAAGPATQPVGTPPPIGNPPFTPYRTNQ
ncbi:MAG TPA: cytochrome c oxidase subunit II [Humisphaera sp.]|jgi:cytochrome c oxidase subunit 2|nr:cytochrome c oxidase subunit II [Humisphaera sp.]